MNKNLIKQNYSNYVYPNIRKLGQSVSLCTTEINLYSNCCKIKDLNISQYDCQKEFEMLKNCVITKMRK